MSADTSDKPGPSRRVRQGGGDREERQKEKREEERVERIDEGAERLRDQGSGSRGVPVLQRELDLQREVVIQKQLTIQINIVRTCAVILTLLSVLFVTRTVDMAMDYKSAINNLTLERELFLSRYDNLTLLCQTIHGDNLTLKITQLERELNQCKRERAVKSCPSGWKQSGCSCYLRSTEQKTWEESRGECVKAGAHLVIINSKEEQDFISGWSGEGDLWIGLQKREGTAWTWVDGTALTTGYWGSGKPGGYVHWDCAYYQSSDGKWSDKGCSSEKNNWICEKDL